MFFSRRERETGVPRETGVVERTVLEKRVCVCKLRQRREDKKRKEELFERDA
jgi:hypothetical protein